MAGSQLMLPPASGSYPASANAGGLVSLYSGVDAYSWPQPVVAPYDPRHVSYPFWPGIPIYPEWNTEKGVREGYYASSVFYAGASRIATLASGIPWIEQKLADDGGWEPVEDSDLENLLERPNPKMSRGRIVYRKVLHMLCGGNGLWGKYFENPDPDARGRDRGKVLELWPESPVFVQPIPHPTEWILGYLYWDGANRRVWRAEDLIHSMMEDPINPYWGAAPLKVLARGIDADNAMVDAQRAIAKNLGVPAGMFSAKDFMQGEEGLEAWRSEIYDAYVGPDKRGLPFVTGGDVKWEALGMKPSEMDWIDSRGVLRDEFAMVLHIDPAMFDRAGKTYANSELAHRAMYHFAVMPLIDIIREALNLSLIGREEQRTRYITYDTSGIIALRDDIGKKLTALKDAVQSGVPLNDALTLLDLPVSNQEGGDVAFILGSLVPLKRDLSGAATVGRRGGLEPFAAGPGIKPPPGDPRAVPDPQADAAGGDVGALAAATAKALRELHGLRRKRIADRLPEGAGEMVERQRYEWQTGRGGQRRLVVKKQRGQGWHKASGAAGGRI